MIRFKSALLAALLGIIVCGASDAAGKTYYVGTEAAYAPFNYVDEAGAVDGYDAAVVRAIDELLPDAEFEFVPTDWSAIFVALESGRFDAIASTISRTEERQKKYLFSEEPYLYMANAIITKGGRTDIKGVKDLHGKTVALGIGTANTLALEKYNEENGNPINVIYTDGELSKTLQEVINGRADAFLANPVAVTKFTKEQGIGVEIIIWRERGVGACYLLFANSENGRKLKELTDPVLEKLKADGTLAELSNRYLGADYTSEAALLGE
ncbi:MAG: transporter substrate-binding domain-containing protein [Synergistaceae bacterium]|jgi:ABC-type amino acid transport substrate-binding protein|nr:transporter substrate-binding domain-containing protein [Synergistaceae bacterium]